MKVFEDLSLYSGLQWGSSEVTFGQVWWHTQNLSSAFNPSKCTHTVVNTHTHREHTPRAVGMQPYCNLQHLGCNSDSLTIRPWSSPCRWRSWLHAFTVLTNRKPLGLKVTSVWAVLHIIHHQTTNIGLSWVYYWDGTNGLKVQMTVSMQLQRDTWSQPRNKGLIQQNNQSFKKNDILSNHKCSSCTSSTSHIT